MQEFQKEVASGKASITIELLKFVKTWLSGHILKNDHAYAPLLIQKKVA